MNTIIIFAAKYLLIASVISLAVYWWRAPGATKRQLALLTLASGIVAIALSRLSGHFIYDARPFVSSHITPLLPHAADNGFPSDHTLFTSLLGFVAYRYSKRLGWALLAIALAVGAARVAAGVHHWTDIIGAFVISGLAVAVVSALLGRRQAKSTPHSAAQTEK